MDRTDIFAVTIRHFLAPVAQFLDDPTVSEVMINTADEIYIEKDGALVRTDAKFESQEAFVSAVNNILQYTGKRLTAEHPLQDSRLPDGSRVHVILGPLSRRGTCMTIRKFAKVMFNADHLVTLGSWTQQAMEYLRMCVLGEKNLLVAGGTSSGKTCLLNVLSAFIPDDQRIVVIEDSAELMLQQNHVISLESRGADRYGRGEVTIRDLFRSALRLRPDRIIIGECRGGEALEIIQAMTSGHAGSMSTLHANSPLDTLNRLETLCMMSKVDLPLYAMRAQVTSAIDVLVQVTRFSDGRRAVTAISEVLPLNAEGQYQVRPMFTYELGDQADASRGELKWTGQRSQYGREPRILALSRKAELTGEIFGHEAPRQARGVPA
ncbi:MAG TPA: ATPase, T2SS/T4P/T4SS family [Phycisphaerae bacterium]|nr:ATPase, T2SS/T4P/T4SS family [Phycisphaerae bacterium]